MKSLMNVSVKGCMMLLFAMLVSLSANAVPAKPGLVRTLNLSDGTTVSARLVGDEFGHYWLGTDGKAYRADAATGLFQAVDAQAVMASAKVKRTQANTRRTARMAPRKVGGGGNYTGKKKGLIILVNFYGTTFKSANNNALYQRIANEENFVYDNFVGSMYDYFYAQSEGQFELTFDVVGPVEVSNTQSYYGSNDSEGNDKHPAEMVIEALKKADSYVNYADYDWDGDGEVDQVYVVYAGKGEADGGGSSTIWPHEWDLSTAAYYGDGAGRQKLDGVYIDTYACGAELDGTTGTIAGIGTMCHEFSHCLGYPDFYDTDYSGGQGMGYWDLMDGGSYNGDSFQPAGYTSYERWVAGWKEPIELTASKAVTGMKGLQEGGESYIIYNGGNSNEYFLLENRQFVGWDASLPAEGLLILHVDYDASAWSNNTPNDEPSHQRMTWIPADNTYQYTTYQGTKYYTFDGMANDTYPYGSVNSFNKSTTPAAKFYNKNTDGTYYLDSSVENITLNSDGTISFNFVGISNVATPTFSPKAGVYTEAQSVTISCETEGAAIYYTLDGSTPTASSTPYTQPILVETTTTIKAIAIADGEESAVAIGKFAIGSDIYRLVTSADELEAGKNYLLVYEDGMVAYNGFDSNKGKSGDVIIENNEIDMINPDNEATILVLENSNDGNWLIKDGDDYLALTTKRNTLNTQTSATATGTEWAISITNGKAYIKNLNYTDYYLQYNAMTTGMIFRCYKGTQKYPSLYKEVETTPQLKKGDVNGDGKIDIGDVVAIVSHILGDTPPIFHEDVADWDDNGSINISDAVSLVNYLLTNGEE
ncbi:MAG: M6 family metalloprotease domain-containing protein [Prevotella sp.]|nr:M6 family metalloprotease domain-containing protein [Prevotella sp.]